MLNQKWCLFSFRLKQNATSHLRVKNVGHLWKGEHVALASTRAQQGSKRPHRAHTMLILSVKHPPLQVRQQRHKHTGYTRNRTTNEQTKERVRKVRTFFSCRSTICHTKRIISLSSEPSLPPFAPAVAPKNTTRVSLCEAIRDHKGKNYN